jgi:hypothetical protein
MRQVAWIREGPRLDGVIGLVLRGPNFVMGSYQGVVLTAS